MPEPVTITDAADLIRCGGLTPVELLDQCLARVDRYEDRVKAWAHLDRDGAREQAERLTAELRQNNYRGPLHGIPIGVKDIIDVFDLPTGCGSKLWANSYARRDATCVGRLRQAGAVILGKTVTTPFASFDPPVTRNPWNLDRTPGGSSSGSAAAVACGMCLGALGTQTGGSITRPASYCGVYSLKPTHGRVSADGVLPLAPSLDHVGVMANCVRDLALLFRVITGLDRFPAADPLEKLDKLPLPVEFERSARLTGMFDDLAAPELREALDRVLRRGTSNYFVRKAVAPPAGFADVLAAHRLVMAVEAAEYHAPRLARHPDDYPPNVRGLIEEGLRATATAYHAAQNLQYDLADSLRETLDGGWALLTPATTTFPPPADTTGDPAFNSPWSYTRHPTVSLPAGWSSDGLPFAVQLVGADRDEARLLAAAAWYERGLRFEPRPVPL